MEWTKNGTRKIILLHLIGIILVCFINKGASNANSCPNPRYIANKNSVIVANCLARWFAHQYLHENNIGIT